MKKIHVFVLLTLLAGSVRVFAHEGETHGEPTSAAKVSLNEGAFTLSAVTENFEVVVKYPPADPGKEMILVIYVADYATNKPISDAVIDFEIKGLESVKPKVEKTDIDGVYQATVTLPDAQAHDLVLTISGNDVVDLIPINGLQAGVTLESVVADEHASPATAGFGGKLLLGGVVLLVLAAGGVAFYAFGKRRAAVQKVYLSGDLK